MAQARSGTTIGLQLQLTHILLTEEARSRAPDRARLPAANPHRQIFHEGDQRMHWGHRTSQLVHIHHLGSHLRILANETAPRIATTDHIHHSQPRTIPLDHFTHGTTEMPGKFQRLMEQVLRGLRQILIYINDVPIHTDTHEKHLEALEQVLTRLHQHHLKINLDKCLFGDQQVSCLGFTLTPEGIKPGEAKLKTIRNATPPNNI